MPQYIRIVVIAVLSAVVSSQAVAQGNSNQSNGLTHVIQEALENGINVEVTNSPAVTVENQVDVSVVGETEVVVTNASPIEVTVSNFPDTSGGDDDESGYLGLSTAAIDGAGGITTKVLQCQADYGALARMCSDEELINSRKITKYAVDLQDQGAGAAWTSTKLLGVVERRSGSTLIKYYTSFNYGSDNISATGVCYNNSERGVGATVNRDGAGGISLCSSELHVACCR